MAKSWEDNSVLALESTPEIWVREALGISMHCFTIPLSLCRFLMHSKKQQVLDVLCPLLPVQDGPASSNLRHRLQTGG